MQSAIEGHHPAASRAAGMSTNCEGGPQAVVVALGRAGAAELARLDAAGGGVIVQPLVVGWVVARHGDPSGAELRCWCTEVPGGPRR
jgi:hypothetical protein